MANVCTFEMRVRGTKKSCFELLDSGISCYEMYITEEKGTDEDYMLYIEGECRWSVTGSMVNTDDNASLADKAKQFDVELEIFGYDKSEPEWVEHYHYKGEQCLKSYNLSPFIMEWNFDEMDLSEEQAAMYDYRKDPGVYVLKPEFEEFFEWDEDNEVMKVNFTMSFDDLAR